MTTQAARLGLRSCQAIEVVIVGMARATRLPFRRSAELLPRGTRAMCGATSTREAPYFARESSRELSRVVSSGSRQAGRDGSY